MDKGGRLARLEIEPDRAAPSLARRWVRDALGAWDLGALCEDVEIVVGELVVNVVLHAGTAAEIVLRPSGAGVRLEVTDHRPEFLPAEASTGLNSLFELDEEEGIAGVTALDVETTTGRGLRLVAAVSDSWGVVPGDGTKTVWAQIGGPAADTDEGSSDSILDLEAVDPVAAPPGAVLIRMAGVPTRLVLTSAANLDDLIREFRMAGSGSDALRGDLSELAENFLAMTTNVRQPFRDAAVIAIEARQRLLDVSVAVPPNAGPNLRAFRDVVDQIVYYCRHGELLSLAPDDEIIAFRRWYVDEIERQIAGSPPRACPFAVLPADDPALTPAGDVPLGLRPPRPGWLERAASSLGHAHDVTSVASTAVNAAAHGVGAATGSLCLLEDDGLTVRLVTAVAYRQEIEGEWRTFGVGDDVPASECIRTNEPIFLRTLEERTIRYPIFGVPPGEVDHGLACLPVERGCLVLGYSEPRPFDDEEQRGLMQLAYLVNEALIRIAERDRPY